MSGSQSFRAHERCETLRGGQQRGHLLQGDLGGQQRQYSPWTGGAVARSLFSGLWRSSFETGREMSMAHE